ncbi:hypothetical protein MBLNU459_g1209t1 [Dothideomycetes sp. NU459]
MAESFIGMTISVTLQNPPGAVVMGRVNNVIAGQTLALEQVFFPGSGNHAPAFSVPASNILDLQVVDTNSTGTTQAAPPQPPPPSQPMNVAAPKDLPLQQPTVETPSSNRQSFVDPAILSFGKSPAPAPATRAPPQEQSPATPIRATMAAAAAKLPSNSSPFVGVAPEKRHPSTKAAKKQLQEEAAGELAEENGELDEAQSFDPTQSSNMGKKTRRGRRGPKSVAPVVAAATEAQTVKEALSPNVSRNGLDMNATPGNNRKGWRSTPLLKETNATPTANSTAKGKKKSKRAQAASSELQNGWATEDATDIQDLGDFDFEANLNKFDKRTVFDQIRNEDTTADEDRLVSHNRLPPARPGTYGGKNLHPTENVLSPPLKPKTQGSDLESASDADTELNFGSGQNSRRAMSRTSNKRAARRSNSGAAYDGDHPLSASIASNAFNRSMSSLRGGSANAPPSITTSSPNPHRTRSPVSVSSPMRSLDQLSLTLRQQPHFRTRTSKQACSIFHPEKLRQVEAEIVSNMGISPEAMTESAARSIADSVISIALRPGASRRNSKANSNMAGSSGKPVVVVLAGNHITGARAVASARHLYGRGLKVLISVLDFSNPSVWHPQLGRQIQSLQALGRKAARIEGWRSTSAHIKRLEGPPAIIIDALLDGQRHTDFKSVEQQLESRDMIDWANRSRAGVVSVNIPSGFSATDGTTSVVEGEPLAIRPQKVLVLGAPVNGLLEAVKEGEGADWTISCADIGVNVALGERERIDFGSEWSTGLKFFSGDQA